MPTVISATSSHRTMPQVITYSTSPPASSYTSSRKSSSPGLSSISRASHISSNRDSKSNPQVRSGGFSAYSPTTVSSYRRRIDVEGLPGPQYFSSGQSKLDRRREYVQPPAPPSAVFPAHPSPSSTRRSVAGREVVKYRDSQLRESDDEDEGDDTRTLGPDDSISQVSYPGSYTSSRGRQGRRDSGISVSGDGGSTFSEISTFQSDRVFDGTRQCYLVERRPRASATAVR